MARSDSETLQVALRPLASADFLNLVDWINAPHVAQWWDGLTDLQAVTAKYESYITPDALTRIFAIEVNGRAVGMIQCYRHASYPEWERDVGILRAAGIDYLVGDLGFTGKGIGPTAIKQITEFAFEVYSDIEVVVSVPQRDNRFSCRALEKAGFERVEERKLDSECPSDSGVSCIYVIKRPATERAGATTADDTTTEENRQ